MNAAEIIEKLKMTFAELVAPPAPAPSPAPVTLSSTLADGTEIEVTEMAVGGVVTISGMPAPAGEHELSDGTKIVLDDNGVISEIMPAASAAPVTPEMDMGQKFTAFESATNEKFASYEQKFADYETRISGYEAKLNKATSVIEGLLELTQKIAATPVAPADPAAAKPGAFAKDEKKYTSILFS